MDFYAVTGGGVEFYGQAESSRLVDHGFAVEAVEGLGPVGLVVADSEAVGDGDYAGPARYASRLITITGQAMASSELALAELRHQLGGLGPVDSLLVERHGQTLRYTGGWRGQPRWEPRYLADGAMAYYQVTFKALRPFGLGARHQLSLRPGQSARASTHGNMPAWPSLTLRGPLSSGLELSHGEHWFRVNHAVPAGHTWTLDWQTAILRDHSGKQVVGANRGHPGPIPIEGATLRLTGAGSGSVDVVWHDTYN